MVKAGYSATHVGSGEEAFFIATTEAIDAIIMDLGLPGRDGMEILGALRVRQLDIPILILSARSEVADRVQAIRSGADDYLLKPFSIDELEARIQALLRRGKSSHPGVLVVADLTLDIALRRVTRADSMVTLTALEFDILELLMRNAGTVVSRQTLTQCIWKDINRATPLDNVMDVHLGRIRKKIDKEGMPKLIHTIRGVGFLLSVGRD